MCVHQVAETHCKTCLHKISAHSGVSTDDKPKQGDYSICFYCGTISTFDESGNLVKITEQQLAELENDPESLMELQQAAFYIMQRNALQ